MPAKVPTIRNRVDAAYTPASGSTPSAPSRSVSAQRMPICSIAPSERGTAKRQNRRGERPPIEVGLARVRPSVRVSSRVTQTTWRRGRPPTASPTRWPGRWCRSRPTTVPSTSAGDQEGAADPLHRRPTAPCAEALGAAVEGHVDGGDRDERRQQPEVGRDLVLGGGVADQPAERAGHDEHERGGDGRGHGHGHEGDRRSSARIEPVRPRPRKRDDEAHEAEVGAEHRGAGEDAEHGHRLEERAGAPGARASG